jgi:3-oxoacyl-[acyl-carrier protein] reductase
MNTQTGMNYQSAMRLDGRGLVVLSAGQGVGLESARTLAQQGASVLCIDRDKDLADAAAGAIGGHYGMDDVTKEADVACVFTQTGELFRDRFAGAVNIVGRADLRPITEFSEEEWDSQFGLILRHAFFN